MRRKSFLFCIAAFVLLLMLLVPTHAQSCTVGSLYAAWSQVSEQNYRFEIDGVSSGSDNETIVSLSAFLGQPVVFDYEYTSYLFGIPIPIAGVFVSNQFTGCDTRGTWGEGTGAGGFGNFLYDPATGIFSGKWGLGANENWRLIPIGPTPTVTLTPSPITVTPSPTAAATATSTATETPTLTPSLTATAMPTPEPTATPPNNPPVVLVPAEVFTVTQGISFTVPITVTDADLDPVFVFGSAGHGVVDVDLARLIYTPTVTYTGVDTATVVADDGRGGTASGDVRFNVIAPAPPEQKVWLPVVLK